MIKLKDILFEIMTEARPRKRGSGELNWQMKSDGLHIPGICIATDTLEINIIIDYNYTGGSAEVGAFGPSYKAKQSESPEVEILGHKVAAMVVKPSTGGERQVFYDYLIPQQQQVIDEIIDTMGLQQEDKIEEAIINQEEG